MILRIAAGNGSRPVILAPSIADSFRCFATSTIGNSSTNERNIFVESPEEEEAEKANKRSLLQEQRDQLAQYPVWDGDERVQDTILRMVMDKHQPLRMKGNSNHHHPADAKMSTIQKPSMLTSPSFAKPSSSAAIADVDQVVPEVLLTDADGRRLAKTPDNRPWAAVYVNPMRRDGDGEAVVPSIHYGKYLGLPRSSSSRILPKTASGKERLKLAGIKTESLPMDDRNKMKAIREGVRRWDRAGRMRGVKEEAFNYRRAREEERERQGREITEEEVEEFLQQQEGVLKEGEEMKLTSGSSDSKPGEAVIAMSGGRGFTSVANERIEAAMKTEYFQRNALRGKPFQRDIHAMNPFLKGEERIMNRLIQKQGAAPPWVELNSQVETDTTEWRSRLIDNWVRRASRIILSSSHMRRGLEPIRVKPNATYADLEEASVSAGQRKMLTLVCQYRDAEWEAREKQYHEASLKEVNNVIRKYNIVAPTSVRRGLLARESELQRAYEEARVRLVGRLNEGLNPSALSPNFNLSNGGKGGEGPHLAASPSSTALGSPVDSSRMGAGFAMGGGMEEGASSGSTHQSETHGRHKRRNTTSYTFQLTSFVKRVTQQLVGK